MRLAIDEDVDLVGISSLSTDHLIVPGLMEALHSAGLDHARVVVGGPERLRACDLVVANMTGDELSQALDAILAIWTRRGALVLGGMRAHEVAGLLARVLDAGTREVHRREVGAFTAVAFEARAGQAVR